MLDQVFSSLAASFSAQFGAPFIDAIARWTGTPTLDAGGSIVTSTGSLSYPCKAQFDAPTQAMRADAGFLATDVRILVLTASLGAVLNTSAKIIAPSGGANAGTWELLSVTRDPASIGYECRGRRV